ncbi:hypothetical protein AMTR_s00639p00011180 [Amborella trichopoda]|uniref:Uncharacterized protein n=1 Tax=Amborella trichopoda TaxID=13333 RepID=W1NPP2_AMBTC|nr:hypothetical protein AMTR_s00639p00011180 [Amborella trichopoda]
MKLALPLFGNQAPMATSHFEPVCNFPVLLVDFLYSCPIVAEASLGSFCLPGIYWTLTLCTPRDGRTMVNQSTSTLLSFNGEYLLIPCRTRDPPNSTRSHTKGIWMSE